MVISKRSELRRGAAIGANQPGRQRVDMKFVTGIGRHAIETQAHQRLLREACQNLGKARNVIDQSIALGTLRHAIRITCFDNSAPHRARLQG